MKKLVLTAVITLTLATTSFGYVHQMGTSNQSFPVQELTLCQ
ncbi:hypothetical protein [Candidatus Francisella endociliophora]|nr:hypothetical protein [Francisella sp. FSC1006]